MRLHEAFGLQKEMEKRTSLFCKMKPKNIEFFQVPLPREGSRTWEEGEVERVAKDLGSDSRKKSLLGHGDEGPDW